MITTSSTCKSLLGRVHFRHSCKLSRNYFLQRDQNLFAKCWTRLQRFLQYTSAGWETPGGARTTFDFIVSSWLGVKGLGESGSEIWFTVNGRLLTIASASHIRVLRDSSSNCRPLLFNSNERTLRMVLIWHSHTPPMWLAAGTFILKETNRNALLIVLL